MDEPAPAKPNVAAAILVLAGAVGIGLAGMGDNPAAIVSFVVGIGLLIDGYRSLRH